MATAEEKRREVLRRIQNVIEHATGPRMHDSMTRSQSVTAEIGRLISDGLIEPCERDGEEGYRRTIAGDEYLKGLR